MSYGNNSGGTLTLPSPNTVHHVDVTAAVRSLRRSLSRSPSKLNIARSYSQSSEGTISTPGSPSPCRIIQRPMPPASAPQLSHQHSQANLSTPFRPGVKLSLRSGKPKAASAKPLGRATRVSPKSPIKRILNNTTDSGNMLGSLSPPSSDTLSGQENDILVDAPPTLSPTSRKSYDRHQSRHSMHLDVSGGASKNIFPRLFESAADPLPTTSVSPLKRSDAFMSPIEGKVGSPVPKRRSMHGVTSTSTSEPNIFDLTSPAPRNFAIHEDRNKNDDDELDTEISFPPEPPVSPTPAAMPRRHDSLRRSTLQQRPGDKSSWGRRQGERHLAQMGTEAATPFTKSRPRVSLDQFVQPALPRDSPFSSQPPLPNPSLHLLDRPNATNQPHPLSRSVTTSSSNSSLPDDSPTHIPVLFERPRAAHPFAKSLPLGARPLFENGTKNAATPAYKNARPLQDAFKSTGLISKVNRNPELGQSTFGESKAIMPDTPCKKPIYPSNTYPPSSGGGKGRHHPFGSPPSPFSPGRKDSFVLGEPEKVSSLFKSFQPSQARRGSIFNPDCDLDSQNLADSVEFPPTPTKSVFFRSIGNSKTVPDSPFVKTAAASMPATVSAVSFRDIRHIPDPLCKSSFSQHPFSAGVAKQTHLETAQTEAVPRGELSPRTPELLSFHTKPRTPQVARATPEPLRLGLIGPLVSSQKRVKFTKTAVVITASPLGPFDKFAAKSPKTPRDNNALMPPDLSSLSIPNNEASNGATFGSFLPETPTARQGAPFGGFADRRMSITPVNGQGLADMDMDLKSRFDQVEVVGKGEFSQVYRVAKIPASTAISQNGTPGTPPTPSQAQVFAVKKTRLPFFGARDREAKMREVKILKTLRGRPHVLQYVDSWEKQYHLYIQTEYCEEGSLSSFLGTVGAAGRLDDFRIWKILVETGMGLQSIHEAGFIHLDLKPANVLVNYEGQLKIGDFGMATPWPAARGIEGEGDRRYIAPEILQSKYDKPADVFSLGLIMFEIASNVWLPDNGPHWLALREGNFSAVPTGPLTGSESDALVRDVTGMPIVGDTELTAEISPLDDDEEEVGSAPDDDQPEFSCKFMHSPTHDASNLFGAPKRSELQHPPAFMIQASHGGSLDQVVTWMLAPNPADRPTIQQLLGVDSLRWVITHRRAGATVFEGNWGPQEDGELDTEMADA